jgi:hypothetical protein
VNFFKSKEINEECKYIWFVFDEGLNNDSNSDGKIKNGGIE